MSSTQKLSATLLVTALAVCASACGDDTEAQDMTIVKDLSVPPSEVPHNFQQINDLVLWNGCAKFKSCHSTAGNSTTKLNLCSATFTSVLGEIICEKGTVDDAYAALVKVVPNDKDAKADGNLVVDPCKPENSFLVKKLQLPTTNGKDDKYGESMPKDNPHLDAPVVKAISDWIARGAHRNEPADVTGTTCVMGD